MLESDTFNNEMSLAQAKSIQCSPAMVCFSSHNINILQHIKRLICAIVLVPGALVRRNMVYSI